MVLSGSNDKVLVLNLRGLVDEILLKDSVWSTHRAILGDPGTSRLRGLDNFDSRATIEDCGFVAMKSVWGSGISVILKYVKWLALWQHF